MVAGLALSFFLGVASRHSNLLGAFFRSASLLGAFFRSTSLLGAFFFTIAVRPSSGTAISLVT